MRRRTGATLAAALLLAGCESTNLAPANGPTARVEDDERRMWARAREEQAVLERSGFLLRDAATEKYLRTVLARLHAQPLAEDAQLRVQVLVDPSLIAFALPDGTIFFHTGLLAAIGNEAQLAAVLGHELTHATHRHQLKAFRDLKNKTAFAAGFSAGTAGVGALFGAFGAVASVSGYARDLEREADVAGFRLMADAGYDVREAKNVFNALLDESRRSKIREPFFFGSHPRLLERIASYDQLVAERRASTAGSRVATEDYETQLAEVFLRNAEAAERSGDVDAAIASCERYRRIRPEDVRATLLLADIHRKRDADPAKALELYREVIERQSGLAEPHRSLGLLLFKQSQPTAAAVEFRRYLELKPAANDRTFVENLLQQCETQR